MTLSSGFRSSVFAPLFLGAVAAAVPVGYSLWPGDATHETAEDVVLQLTTAQAVGLLRASLGPEELTAAGLKPAEGKAVIDAGKEALATHAQALATADADYAAARGSVDTLGRKVRSGLASEQEVTALATAKADLAAAEGDREAAFDAIWAGATASLGTDLKARLAQIRANDAWKLPAAYRTVERTEAEWVELRDILDQKKVCTADGVELDGACATYLASIEGDATVAAALSGVATHHASLQASWDAALSGN